MSIYHEIIKRATGFDNAEAAQIEDVMRNVIFHSTLDWQTREELEDAARMAAEVIRQVGLLPAKSNDCVTWCVAHGGHQAKWARSPRITKGS